MVCEVSLAISVCKILSLLPHVWGGKCWNDWCLCCLRQEGPGRGLRFQTICHIIIPHLPRRTRRNGSYSACPGQAGNWFSTTRGEAEYGIRLGDTGGYSDFLCDIVVFLPPVRSWWYWGVQSLFSSSLFSMFKRGAITEKWTDREEKRMGFVLVFLWIVLSQNGPKIDPTHFFRRESVPLLLRFLSGYLQYRLLWRNFIRWCKKEDRLWTCKSKLAIWVLYMRIYMFMFYTRQPSITENYKIKCLYMPINQYHLQQHLSMVIKKASGKIGLWKTHHPIRVLYPFF